MGASRRQFLRLTAGAIAAPACPRLGWTQSYPSRPVRLIVGFVAGGGNDIVARLIGQWLTERLGQPFIIENRPGAGGNIGTEAAVRAPADGHTLLQVGAHNAINASLYGNLSFDFLRDIAPVAAITREPYVVVVNRSVPATNISELVALAKAAPGKLNMASAGVGSGTHVAGELFKMLTGTNLVHVPYRGTSAAMTDLLGGQVQVFFSTMPAAIGYIRAGSVRPLAVSTAARSEAFPDIPTVSDTVPGYEAASMFGLGAPRNTPAEIIQVLNREVNAALADPKMKARLADLGGTGVSGTAMDFGKLIADETRKWGEVVRAANIRPV